ncbi:unnamed protein product [Spirodela intermedia]|uniref:Uncharacterized protein n=2 Tax=Spirodela intermedia TaxID=51605 RepID=A0A7I8J0B2_SPIIN|nr:unnamed protein product [Spirodela intermedia]CAA6663263.1 unnamed protein product [Spirodela intermedia]CAA7399714.1 unnamed protein product [Spirodela intermedia]
MISAKRLLRLARRWQKISVGGSRRITWLKPRKGEQAESCISSSSAPSKGSFVVYSRDRERFVVPLAYLNTFIFRELLQMSEEEFGLPSDGPIVMPCDAALMAQVISVLRRRTPREAEKAIIGAIAGSRCCSSAAPPLGIDPRPSLIPGF